VTGDSAWLVTEPWLDWAARLVPVVVTEAAIAWLDAGQTEPATPPDESAIASRPPSRRSR
jgi:hypothetical protein